MTVHAIVLCLGDAEFLSASLASIYDVVDGITVVTTHDRDWKDVPREPDGLVELVLDRKLDPLRKIELVVTNDTSEAVARNRAMDLADPRPKSIRTRQQHEGDRARVPVDYFWIVDPDEVYDRHQLPGLLRYVEEHRAPLYRMAAVRYFKRWVYRVDGLEWSTAFVRADVRLTHLRNMPQRLHRRAVAKGLQRAGAQSLAGKVLRQHDIPADVAVFHHGSYVGPTERIAKKLESFGHSHEIIPGWLKNVWDVWTPASANFHPAWPTLFPSAREISLEDLPVDVTASPWPAEYLQ